MAPEADTEIDLTELAELIEDEDSEPVAAELGPPPVQLGAHARSA